MCGFACPPQATWVGHLRDASLGLRTQSDLWGPSLNVVKQWLSLQAANVATKSALLLVAAVIHVGGIAVLELRVVCSYSDAEMCSLALLVPMRCSLAKDGNTKQQGIQAKRCKP